MVIFHHCQKFQGLVWHTLKNHLLIEIWKTPQSLFSRPDSILGRPWHGSLNVPIEHHPTIRYMVYNGYYKVMSNVQYSQNGTVTNPCMTWYLPPGRNSNSGNLQQLSRVIPSAMPMSPATSAILPPWPSAGPGRGRIWLGTDDMCGRRSIQIYQRCNMFYI